MNSSEQQRQDGSPRERIETHVDPEIGRLLRDTAKAKGRSVDQLVEEGILLVLRHHHAIRDHVPSTEELQQQNLVRGSGIVR